MTASLYASHGNLPQGAHRLPRHKDGDAYEIDLADDHEKKEARAMPMQWASRTD